MVAYSKIVVAGGGVIGNSVAYYLAKMGSVPVTIVDPVGIAPAASGKAGGFLAKDWSDGSPVGPLQRRSFDLHASLAKELEGTDYRRLTCAAVALSGGRVSKPKGRKLDGVEWADLNAIGSRSMGDESTIAQVHPRKLCRAMWDYAQREAGSTLHIGRVSRAVVADGKVCGVALEDGTTLEADALVIACGPWTDAARSWFGGEGDGDDAKAKELLPRMRGVKYHSILVPSPNRVLSQAVFFQGGGDPEVYPRPDGDAYVTGFPDSEVVVTEEPGQEEVRDEAVQRLKDAVSAVSSELGGIEPHTTQACYLPCTADGVPVIGPIDGAKGAFVASGHSCWGILNAPATGEAVAELIIKGETSQVDLRPYSVDRFLARRR